MKTVQNRPPTERADSIAALLREQDRYAERAASLAAEGRTSEAKEARETAEFIGKEIVESADPEALRSELATCERLAGEIEDPEAAGRWRHRARKVEDVIQRSEAEEARNRARNADFSFVRGVMGGHQGESVLDN